MVKNMDKFKNPYESTKTVMLGANVLQLKKTKQDIKEDDLWLNDLCEPVIPGKDYTGDAKCTLKFKPAPPK